MRVVHKTGLIKRRTFEISLDKVESVDVNQSILGRLMNYGDLTIQGVGERTQTISTIASPLAFRSAITTRQLAYKSRHGATGTAFLNKKLLHAKFSRLIVGAAPPFATKIMIPSSRWVWLWEHSWSLPLLDRQQRHAAHKKAPDNAGAKVLPAGEALISNGPLSALRNRRSGNWSARW
jgi:hypothetical protein